MRFWCTARLTSLALGKVELVNPPLGSEIPSEYSDGNSLLNGVNATPLRNILRFGFSAFVFTLQSSFNIVAAPTDLSILCFRITSLNTACDGVGQFFVESLASGEYDGSNVGVLNLSLAPSAWHELLDILHHSPGNQIISSYLIGLRSAPVETCQGAK